MSEEKNIIKKGSIVKRRQKGAWNSGFYVPVQTGLLLEDIEFPAGLQKRLEEFPGLLFRLPCARVKWFGHKGEIELCNPARLSMVLENKEC